jgi:hypothetical protein
VHSDRVACARVWSDDGTPRGDVTFWLSGFRGSETEDLDDGKACVRLPRDLDDWRTYRIVARYNGHFPWLPSWDSELFSVRDRDHDRDHDGFDHRDHGDRHDRDGHRDHRDHDGDKRDHDGDRHDRDGHRDDKDDHDGFDHRDRHGDNRDHHGDKDHNGFKHDDNGDNGDHNNGDDSSRHRNNNDNGYESKDSNNRDGSRHENRKCDDGQNSRYGGDSKTDPCENDKDNEKQHETSY